MAIKGLTDKPTLRRDGKIRSGVKGENGYPVNTPFFPLHDAPQLMPILTDKPTEIFFTVYFDDINAVAPSDLRWYTKSELKCVGDGENAAYMGTNDLSGLTQQPGFTTEIMPDGSTRPMMWNRSKHRVCKYKSCPEYIAGECSEHIRLDMVIPQYSMGSLFTLENTSINGLLNIMGAFTKCRLGNFHRGGKISGEIFRLYKEKVSLGFENAKTGQRSRSDRDVVHMEHVPFTEYEKNFKDKCPSHSWEALLALRGAQHLLLPSSGNFAIPALEDQGVQRIALPPPTALAEAAALPPQNDDAIVKERANHPSAVPLFEELAKLRGVENSEDKRMGAARGCGDVQKLVDRLKAAIAGEKKKQKEAAAAQVAQAPVTPPVGEAKTPEVMPPAPAAPAAPQGTGKTLW